MQQQGVSCFSSFCLGCVGEGWKWDGKGGDDERLTLASFLDLTQSRRQAILHPNQSTSSNHTIAREEWELERQLVLDSVLVYAPGVSVSTACSRRLLVVAFCTPLSFSSFALFPFDSFGFQYTILTKFL